MALLEVKGLEVYYGVIQALKGIDFEVNEGEIVTLIGANEDAAIDRLRALVRLLPCNRLSVLFRRKRERLALRARI